MELKKKIQNTSAGFYDEIVQIRRHLHANPELSFNEFQTSEYICQLLDSWGIKYRKGVVKTGIVGEISGNSGGKLIALRADMDALPVTENNNFAFKSLNKGVMHACGHDIHMAALLGAIKILKELKDEIHGSILFIFQPGEERIPGGAKLMLEEDIFGNRKPDLILAQHVYPDFEVGNIGLKSGKYMASSDEIYITVKGKGGHAALPERLIDPVLIASQMIQALQQISSRNNKPGVPTVLSFGRFIADGAVNVIPDEVKIEGTFRTMDEEWRAKAHTLIANIVDSIASSAGGSAELEIRKGYPVLVNDENLTPVISDLAVQYLGKEHVKNLDIRMTAEDFAYFSLAYPSVMYRLGTTEPGKEPTSLHSPAFTADERAIKLGMELMSWFTIRFLKQN